MHMHIPFTHVCSDNSSEVTLMSPAASYQHSLGNLEQPLFLFAIPDVNNAVAPAGRKGAVVWVECDGVHGVRDVLAILLSPVALHKERVEGGVGLSLQSSVGCMRSAVQG